MLLNSDSARKVHLFLPSQQEELESLCNEKVKAETFLSASHSVTHISQHGGEMYFLQGRKEHLRCE